MSGDRSATSALHAGLVPALAIWCSAALAANPGGERTCFGNGFTPTFQSGDALPTPGSFAVALQPQARVIYPVRIQASSAEHHGGVVTFENLPPGRYAIRLSATARVMVVQDNSVTAALRLEATLECSEAIAADEFASDGGPVTLQISDVVPSRLSVIVWRP